MNFFERQRTVRSSSFRLVLLFVLAVVAIVAVLDVLAYVLVSWAAGEQGGFQDPQSSEQALNPWVAVAATTIIVAIIIGLTSWVRMSMLKRGGGVAVAESVGAVALEDLPDSPMLRRYRNVVEEVSIASSTPVPRLFVMTDEAAINAFAAGSTPADAAVAVTQGCLESLNRDELQGVIAHEFSHIVNGDMRLSLRLMGVLAGITGLAVAGRVILHLSSGGRRSQGNAAAMIAVAFLVGMAAIAVGYIGVFFARMIKAAVSRQREYLADASAVQYTRQSAGLAGALKKIGGLSGGSALKNKRTENVSHMLFGEGLAFSRFLATHPPLEERIAVLEPTFNPAELGTMREHWRKAPPDGMSEDLALGLSGPSDGPVQAPRPAHRPPGAVGPLPGRAAAVAARVGTPSATSFDIGAEIVRRIPQHLLYTAHRPHLALPLVYGLVMDADPTIRAAQQSTIAFAHRPALAKEAAEMGVQLDELAADLRLPLAELAFPALRNRPDDELQAVSSTITKLVAADGHTSVLEYCLSTLVGIGLHEARTHTPPWSTKRTTRARAQQPVTTLLSVLSWVGHADPAQAAHAFRAGANVLYPGGTLTYTPPRGLEALDWSTWARLDGLVGADKAALVEAIVATVWADDEVTVAESELVRLVCGILHCPLPPLD